MPAYSHSKANYWYVKACGGEKKGMQGALQTATFPWVLTFLLLFLMPKFKIYPLCGPTNPQPSLHDWVMTIKTKCSAIYLSSSVKQNGTVIS